MSKKLCKKLQILNFSKKKHKNLKTKKNGEKKCARTHIYTYYCFVPTIRIIMNI